MVDPRFDRAAVLFEALVGEPLERRTDLLDEHCAGDDALRKEVLSLLAHHERAEGFLSEPAGDARPRRLGPFRLIRRIASGGMGIVYLAEQESPRRPVALKLLRPTLATREMLERFAHESQVLGRLHHPGIASIYEASTTETDDGPCPYFAMEYVEGLPLSDFASERRLPLRDRVELLVQVCDAVHHAHQNGVVHRDLKPANILVDAEGRAKVLDFGVARSFDADLQVSRRTRTGEILGTVAYMSPEQASGDPAEVDTRTDVYALGVLGYELLSGRLPYETDGKPILEAIRVVSEQEPAPLGAVHGELGRDLQAIFGKALEKEPARRYASASEMAEDLRRSLRHEPVAARPPSTLYQLRKFARRNRAVVASAATIVVLLAVATAVTSSLALRLAEQRDEAVLRKGEAEEERTRAELAAETSRAISSFLEDLLASSEPYVAEERTIAEAVRHASDRVDDLFAGQPDVAGALHARLSSILYSRGDPRAAVEQARRARVLLESCAQPDERSLATTGALLGTALQEAGANDEALDVLGRSVAWFEGHPGTDEVLLGTALTSLGAVLFFQGCYEDAEPVTRRALELRLALHGPDHPYTLTAENNLANLYARTGRLDLAEPWMRRILESSRRLLSNRHPNTIASIYNYADVLRSLGRTEDAEPYFLEVIELDRTCLPPGHWFAGLHASRYGEMLADLGRREEAEEFLAAGHQSLESALGPTHERTKRAAHALADLRAARED